MKVLLWNRGGRIVLALAVLPLILWLRNDGVNPTTASVPVFIASLGKAAAFSGIVLYSLMPVLSMRHKIIETIFYNLGNVYETHKQAGKLSVYLIVAHPLLLGGGRLLNGGSLGNIWDWKSVVILTGIVSLGVLIFVTVISIFAHIRHQNWVWIHRLFGWLLPVFFGHALLARAHLAENPALLTYMLLIGATGFAAFFYRSVLSKYVLQGHKYEVAEINVLGVSVTEIVLKPLGVPLSFEAGQYAFVSFKSDEIDSEAHPYSFSNANNGPYLRFTVKALGDDTKKLRNLTVGTKAFLEGPYGNFSYKLVNNKKQVWIAGGIGITPFLSMARSLSGKKPYDIHFFYGSESIDEAVFLQEFIDITRHKPDNFRTSIVSKDRSGFISADTLQKALLRLDEYDFLICGPPGMMAALKQQLHEAGVSPLRIHTENFAL